MKNWTRLDFLLVITPLILSVGLAGNRAYEHYWFDQAANQVMENISNVAIAVATFRSQTGTWFPEGSSAQAARLYPNPFRDGEFDYQGLDKKLLWRENNFGMVLQLVRFDPSLDRPIPIHIYDSPYEAGEPYLRVLLDYGERTHIEREILIRVQNRLPKKSLAEIDDHYYVIDLRSLINGN